MLCYALLEEHRLAVCTHTVRWHHGGMVWCCYNELGLNIRMWYRDRDDSHCHGKNHRLR